jgi:hypothetical protein
MWGMKNARPHDAVRFQPSHMLFPRNDIGSRNQSTTCTCYRRCIPAVCISAWELGGLLVDRIRVFLYVADNADATQENQDDKGS